MVWREVLEHGVVWRVPERGVVWREVPEHRVVWREVPEHERGLESGRTELISCKNRDENVDEFQSSDMDEYEQVRIYLDYL